MVKINFFCLVMLLSFFLKVNAENFYDESQLLHMYEDLFPATFTAQIYQNFKQMNMHPMIATDCAVKFSYTNGHPTVQLYIIF